MILHILIFLIGFTLGVAAALASRFSPIVRTRAGQAKSWRTIAVPLVEGGLPKAALVTAGQLSVATGAQVSLLALVQVPRGMNLDAGDPPGLQAALARLDAAEKLVRGLGAEVHGEVVRVREIGDLVIHACEEAGAQAVVLEDNPGSRATSELLHALVDSKVGRKFDLVLAPPR